MPRCPTCHRRVRVNSPCPQDGAIAPEAGEGSKPMPAAAPVMDDYDILGTVGLGGFGAVWEGTQRSTGKKIAIKVGHTTDDLQNARFRREAEALKAVGPPWVPELYSAGQLPSKHPYLIMELLHGHTLSRAMEDLPGPLSLAEFREFSDSLLGCMQAIHEHNVVHRDLKPDNIFLMETRRDQIKVMDFGITVAMKDTEVHLTRTGSVVGTPEYMSPEQRRGERDVDARADIYSLGVLFFELLSMRLPFVGGLAAIEYGHLSLRPPRLSEIAKVPKSVDDVIGACLGKEPEQRPSSVKELREALNKALDAAPEISDSVPEVVTPAAAATPAKSEKRKQQLAAVLLCLVSPERLAELSDIVVGAGGVLAYYTAGSRCGLVFIGATTDQPARRAFQVAQVLCEKGVTRNVLVDVGRVIVRQRKDGPPDIVCATFAKAGVYPEESDPSGVLFSAVARDALPGVNSLPCPNRADRFFVVDTDKPTTQPTVMKESKTPLVGRESTMAALLGSAKNAVENQVPTAAMVIADTGLGKTRLAASLLDDLRRQLPAAEVIEIRAREPVGGDADETPRAVMRRLLDMDSELDRDSGLERLREKVGTQIADELFAGVGLLLGWLPPDDPAVKALRAAPGVLRTTVSRAIYEAMVARANKQPLCLVVDNAHWADDSTLDALAQATFVESKTPLWVCLMARPVIEETRADWGTGAQARLVERLPPLSNESAGLLCRELLKPAEYVGDALVEGLVARTAGIPFLLVELVAGLKRAGMVKAKAQGGFYLAAEALEHLPDLPLVEWLAGREIQQLPPDLASHAGLYSILSTEFSLAEAHGVLQTLADAGQAEEFPLDAGVSLKRLCGTGILVKHRDNTYGFRHALVREAIAQAVASSQAARIHSAALRFYQQATGMNENVRLSRLARHAEMVGAKQDALSALKLLADRAREAHVYGQGELLYSRALAVTEDSDERTRMHLLKARGDCRYRAHRYDDALTDLGAARDLADKLGEQGLLIEILLDEAIALDWNQEFAKEKAPIQRAMGLAAKGVLQDAPPTYRAHIEARLDQMGACLAWRLGAPLDAIRKAESAVQRAEAIGDEGYEVLVNSMLTLGALYPSVNRLEEAKKVFERLEALCRSHQDERVLSATIVNRTYLWIAEGDPVRLEADLAEAVHYSKRLGEPVIEDHALLNMSQLLYWMGNYDAALPHADKMVQRELEFQPEVSRPIGQLVKARILRARGDHDAARKSLEEIQTHQELAKKQRRKTSLLLPSEQLLLDMLALSYADADEDEWNDLLEQANEVEIGQELIEVIEVRGQVALEREHYDEACSAFDRALSLCEQIPSPMKQRIQGEAEQAKTLRQQN